MSVELSPCCSYNKNLYNSARRRKPVLGFLKVLSPADKNLYNSARRRKQCNIIIFYIYSSNKNLYNSARRRKPWLLLRDGYGSIIKTYITPQGDGNEIYLSGGSTISQIKTYITPQGDGNFSVLDKSFNISSTIKTYITPQGDGNMIISHYMELYSR